MYKRPWDDIKTIYNPKGEVTTDAPVELIPEERNLFEDSKSVLKRISFGVLVTYKYKILEL